MRWPPACSTKFKDGDKSQARNCLGAPGVVLFCGKCRWGQPARWAGEGRVAAPSEGPLPAGGPAFSGESRRKEHQGAQPPGPPLRGGGSSPENPFSGVFQAGRGFFFPINWPAARSAEGPKASRPPLGRLGDAFLVPMGKTEKIEMTRRKIAEKQIRPRLFPKGTYYRCQPPNRWAARLRSLAL